MGGPKPEEDGAFVIIQDGGVGDAICATPMIESAKKNFPNKTIVVGSAYAEMLEGNPNIDHLYSLGYPGDLFERWVKPLKQYGSVIKRDIYNECAHKLFPGPLSMIWCHLYNVPYTSDDCKIYLTDREDYEARQFLSTFPRPVIIIHPSGARLLFDPKTQITPNKDWFPENWEILVNELNKEYDIIQVGGKQEVEIPGVTTYLMGSTSLRQTAALLKNCLTYVCIDSFVGHCGAGVGKRGVVLFGRSNPYIAGHALNKNIWVKNSCELNDMHCGRPQGYFGDSEMFRGLMRPWVCKNRTCMKAIKPSFVLHTVHNLIKSLKN
jgi:ADP-heptose:LPS heptosyltransferase